MAFAVQLKRTGTKNRRFVVTRLLFGKKKLFVIIVPMEDESVVLVRKETTKGGETFISMIGKNCIDRISFHVALP